MFSSSSLQKSTFLPSFPFSSRPLFTTFYRPLNNHRLTMLFAPALVSALLAAVMASPVPAPPKRNAVGVQLGNRLSDGDDVAWLEGQPQSSAIPITSSAGNPCDFPFTIEGIEGTLQLFGCGTTPFGINNNGAEFAVCAPFSEPDKFGVHTTYHCA
ncbi:hypothetical protein HMN09_00472100 [Mycena chlorophos]|uniref:Uncharacterized protein n=1 Tax=Mycena chlorophos TaxID=658473 RepID=A0A8H6WJN9_MYCCL|nr:hypothetical protein HMN09_00472100 [Mycena chlorophos]